MTHDSSDVGLVRSHSVGRPRSALADEAIRIATLEILAETGYEGLTIESVAARAGVGKPTIYRRWPSKAGLVVDTIQGRVEQEVIPDTGTTRGDLLALVANAVEVFSSDTGGVLIGLVAAMHRSPELAEAFQTSVLAERRAALESVLRRGVERGDLRRDLDPSLVVALLIGPIFHRLLVSREPLTPDLSEQIVGAVFSGIARSGSRSTQRSRQQARLIE